MNQSVLWCGKEIGTKTVPVYDSTSSRPLFVYRFCPVIRGLHVHLHFCHLALAVKQPFVWRFCHCEYDQTITVTARSRTMGVLSEFYVLSYAPK